MMWRVMNRGTGGALTGGAAHDRMAATEKDESLRMSTLDAVYRMLHADDGKLTLSSRCDAFFIDYDMVPLLLQVVCGPGWAGAVRAGAWWWWGGGGRRWLGLAVYVMAWQLCPWGGVLGAVHPDQCGLRAPCPHTHTEPH
jgi:hypothetical protein